MAGRDKLPASCESEGDGGLSDFTRGDLAAIRKLAVDGLLPADRLGGLSNAIAKIVESDESQHRLRISAFRAIAALQVSMMKILREIHQRPIDSTGVTTNQQINIYLPDNGRGGDVPTMLPPDELPDDNA